jgi:CRP-like cAMP-binding protein
VTPLTTWRLPGEDFLAALQESQASSSLLQTSGARLARTHPRLAAATPDGPVPIPQGKHARHDA